MPKRYSYIMGYSIFIHGKGTYWLTIVDGKVKIPALEAEQTGVVGSPVPEAA